MKKLLKILNCICLSSIVLLGATNRAEAFFFKPPMPWDLEIDIPGNAGKVVSEAQALVMQAKTIKSQLNTGILDSISGQIKKSIGKTLKDNAHKKNPGKGIATGNIGGIELNAETNSEEDYYNVYNKLFYTYPSAKNYKAGDEKKGSEGYQIIQAAYKNKSLEYKQDVIVDTYFTGLLTERYLLLVEKTLKRLEECQNSIEKNNCTFFGLKMEEIPSVDDPSEVNGEENPGLLAQMKNAYIVSTIYDRLMRIVEDLVATEAIYQSSKQIDFVKPVSEDEESSAEKYVPRTYNFASRDVKEKIYAKSILSSKEKSRCFEAGGPGCSGYNQKKAEIINMDDAKIMSDIAPITEALNRARDWHNQKIEMPKYKTKFRQYLIAKIIHERAHKALATSEECAKTFLEEHKNPASKYVWGSTKNYNDHDSREENSISRWLIKRYEQETLNKIIGGDQDCDGYYENCPIGYVQKLDEHCVVLGQNGEIVKEKTNLHPCVVEVITDDKNLTSDNSKEDSNDVKTLSEISSERFPQESGEEYEDSDYLLDASDTDSLNEGSRIAAETPWQIGREILEKLVEDKEMVFETAWNDQKSFQKEYLSEKYKNIKNIIRSTDAAVNSYRLAAKDAERASYQAYDNEISKQLSEIMSPIVSCLEMPEAVEEATKEFCNSNTKTIKEGSCHVSGDVKKGTISGRRKIIFYNSKGEEESKTEFKTWQQKASLDGTCAFKNPRSVTFKIEDEYSNKCEKGWDLSVGYLVRSYYNSYLGECRKTVEENAKGMREKAADDEHGRIVAQDKLFDAQKNKDGVINKRISENKSIRAMIEKHENDINKLKQKMKEYKIRMNRYNKDIDEAAQKKKTAENALIQSKQRVQSIGDELDLLRTRKQKGSTPDKGSRSIDCRMMELEYERAKITNDKIQWNDSLCGNVPESRLITVATYESYVAQEKGSSGKKTADLTKFVAIKEAENVIAEQNRIIKVKKQEREFIKEEIANSEKEIREKTEKFADEYIEKQKKSQEVINKANEEFEEFGVEDGKDVYRMENRKKQKCERKPPLIGKKHCKNTTYEKDNLAQTITSIFGKDKTLQEEVETEINEGMIDLSGISNELKSKYGLPAEFFLDKTFSKFGIASGDYTAARLAEEIKKMIVKIAAKRVTEGINKSDQIIDDAIKEALARVEETQKKWKICKECAPLSEKEKENLSNQEYHQNNIIPEHQKLVSDLKNIAEKTTIDDLFGIPENALNEDAVRIDEEYFVALPARGTNYLGREEYEKEEAKVDDGAGRDYLAPREPFIHQPPVREVFYYSAQDFADTPKDKTSPVISYLLDKKYPNTEKQWEYLPEVWRYLLAQPNLRADRKYQQTFIEKSLSSDKFKEIVSGENENYRTIIARGGTYPCKLGNYIIDVVGNNDGKVGHIRDNIKFVKRSNKPFTKMQTCHDINLYNQRPCNTYETRDSKTICHMLSSHGPKESGKGEYTDYQKIEKTENKGMFKNYSELGILLDTDKNYRKMQKIVNEYLLSEDAVYMENDIHRQKAEHAAFTHNIFGSFLETVNAEYTARKSLEKITEEVKSSFESLCSMLHEQKTIVNGEETIPDNCNKECIQEHNKKCAEIMLKNFAKSSEDQSYGTDGEYIEKEEEKKYSTVNCKSVKSTYEEIFCQLDALKNENLAQAEDAFFNKAISNYEPVDKNRVKEHLINIMKEMAALRVDENETTYIMSDFDVDVQEADMDNLNKAYEYVYKEVASVMNNKINEAKTNRTIERENDNLGIASMENQSQIVPYCPFYVYSSNSGL